MGSNMNTPPRTSAEADASVALDNSDSLNISAIVRSTAQSLPHSDHVLPRAREFARPLLGAVVLDTGENAYLHAEGTAHILADMGAAASLQAAAYLTFVTEHLQRPDDLIAQTFGPEYVQLAVEAMRLMQLQRSQRQQALGAHAGEVSQSEQIESVRKMLLAFSRDLRVILLRLASRLQTLRHYAASKIPVPHMLAYESLHVLAPLANRLGIWQIKWEIEDLAFRFLEPDMYRQVANWLDEKRTEREARAERLRQGVMDGLRAQGIFAQVQARPKHIYSIVKKMRGKGLDFSRVYDRMALRVIVPQVQDCYTALSWVHSHFEAEASEFDDYIAKPKANGYQSLHTVIWHHEPGQPRRPVEIQFRTQAMHEHAESGVAAHWAYKEAGARGYAGHSANSAYDAKIAVLRQLLAWERDLAVESHAPTSASAATTTQGTRKSGSRRQTAGKPAAHSAPLPHARHTSKVALHDKIYVLTPQARIVELPDGATPVDFAYSVHTSLGHRCRGARVDGVMVPLNTPLRNGQTVEITSAKEGGPSRDWLSEPGFLVSHRARAKVRAWFNAQALTETMERGREAVEKLLQREGKTAIRLDDLASQLGFADANALFEVVGKDELSLRSIESVLHPPAPQRPQDDYLLPKQRAGATASKSGGILVVGMGSLLTQLAKCCKPVPPDAIGGFVTRGKGVSVHRSDCSNYRNMVRDNPQRAIDVQWQGVSTGETAHYPVDIVLQAHNRDGLLRDVTELFAREKMPIVGLQSHIHKDMNHMTLTVHVSNAHRLIQTLHDLHAMDGVVQARRR